MNVIARHYLRLAYELAFKDTETAWALLREGLRLKDLKKHAPSMCINCKEVEQCR